MTLDIDDKNYIKSEINGLKTEFSGLFDQQFNRISKHMDERFDHYFGVLRDDFNHKFSILVEITKDKPGREEVRQIVREEARYVVREEMRKNVKLETARV